jgi:hypothetical protein
MAIPVGAAALLWMACMKCKKFWGGVSCLLERSRRFPGNTAELLPFDHGRHGRSIEDVGYLRIPTDTDSL